MKHVMVLTMVVAAWSGSAVSAPTLAEELRGSAAYCEFKGSRALGEAYSEMKRSGKTSDKYINMIDESYSIARSCVAEQKPKILRSVKREVESHPSARSVIASAYAAWLGYMELVETPKLSPDHGPEHRKFEESINSLQAEMDLM